MEMEWGESKTNFTVINPVVYAAADAGEDAEFMQEMAGETGC